MRYRIKDGDRTGTYDGLLKNHLCEGKGTIYYDNGDKFVGTFINGYKEGLGVTFYTDGYYHRGYYHLGLKNGIGFIFETNTNKLRFEGVYKNDKFHGRGILYMADGDIICSLFNNGKTFARGTLYYKTNNYVETYVYSNGTSKVINEGYTTRAEIEKYVKAYRKLYILEQENGFTLEESIRAEQYGWDRVLQERKPKQSPKVNNDYINIRFYDPEEEFQKRKEIQEQKQREQQEKQRLIQQKIQQQIQEERQQEYLRKQEEKRIELERQREEIERLEREREREIEADQAKAEELLKDARFYYDLERYDYAKWRVQEPLEHARGDRWIIENCEDLLEDIETREL